MSDELSRFFGTLDQRLEDARQAGQRVLERFFAELGPRLETARTLERELDRQLARRFNVFDYLRTDELGLSKMIGDLLDPEGSHGQGAAFLECLTDKLEFAKDCNLSRSKVDVELSITNEHGEKRRIDIAVRIDDAHGKHCLAIESKANYAVDQRDQVQDYLWWLEQNYSKHLVVYLTATGKGLSEDSVSRKKIDGLKDEFKKGATRRLVIMPCGPSEELDDTFNELRLSFSLADWLADCRRVCDVDRLRWFLREAETFCQRQYGGTTVTTTESSTVKDFVLAHPENIAIALDVYQSWPAIEAQIKKDFLELIYEQLPNNIGKEKDLRGGEICIRIYREEWLPYGKERSCIYLGVQRRGDVYIGVSSISIDKVDKRDEDRRQRLQDAFKKDCEEKQEAILPWWRWIDDKEYQNWNHILRELRQECKDGPDKITNYFVKELIAVYEWAASIIEDIDRH